MRGLAREDHLDERRGDRARDASAPSGRAPSRDPEPPPAVAPVAIDLDLDLDRLEAAARLDRGPQAGRGRDRARRPRAGDPELGDAHGHAPELGAEPHRPRRKRRPGQGGDEREDHGRPRARAALRRRSHTAAAASPAAASAIQAACV